jgi:predicted alpha/beta-hydrolase family hydrolase
MSQTLEFLFNGPEKAGCRIVLGHGAGAPMDAPFMNAVAEGLAQAGIRVARFEFPYMRERREGRRRPPDREPVLLQSWRDAIGELGGRGSLIIGGKSLGGRIASMIADEAGVRGLLCLGYPFHAPGKPEQARIRHLEAMRTPALILQGERDPFGNREEVQHYRLSQSIRIEWIADGDHSFKPRIRSGRTEAENLAAAIGLASRFAGGLS